MNETRACEVIARLIFDNGEYPDSGGLMPSGFVSDPTEYTLASDCLYEKYEATHFSLLWEEKGKSAKLVLYSADAFGAVVNLGSKVFEVIVVL